MGQMEKRAGLGLGYEFMKLNGGQIDINSLGKGQHFILRLKWTLNK
jgi:hypothetical protein